MAKRTYLIICSVVLFLGAILCAFLLSWLEPQIETVDQVYVKEHVGKPGFLLVDVREADVFNGKSPFEGAPGGHIPGAINFPSSWLDRKDVEAAFEKAGLTKDITLILYCNAGLLSGQFAEALVKDFGFKDFRIKSYKVGTLDWSQDPANKLLPEDHDLGK